MKVLVADDEMLSRTVLASVLTRAGYEVVAVDDGDGAMAQLTGSDAPQLAVLDWMMPGKSGIEICRALRADRSRRYTYVIMLTARDSRDDRVECIEAGADDFLPKPVDQAELFARLRSGERVVALENSLAEKVAALEQALAQVKTLEGIITICMHCNRIAVGEDQWQRVEAYVESHTTAVFSHGLCKTCLEANYPDGPASPPGGDEGR